jgi:hypothetical protein
MGTHGSNDVAFFLLGGYSLLGDSTEIGDKIEALTDETMSLGDSWPEHTDLGVRKADLTQNGFFNDATNAMHTALNEQQGVSRVLVYGLEGNTVGKKFVGYAGAMEVDYARLLSLKALHRANASYQGNGQVDEGLILHALGARTTDGDSTGADSIDNLASSANGGVAYLQVIAYSGFSSVVFKVLHDTDDSGYADLVTFTTVTAIGAQRQTVAGTINRHLAASWDVTGSGSVTFMIGFKRT